MKDVSETKRTKERTRYLQGWEGAGEHRLECRGYMES